MSASPLSDVDILRSPPAARSHAQSRTPVASESLAQTGEYSIFGLTRAVDSAIVRERQVGFTLILFGVATIIALLYSVERYFYSRLVGEPLSLSKLVPAELVFTYAWALLTPVVMPIPAANCEVSITVIKTPPSFINFCNLKINIKSQFLNTI